MSAITPSSDLYLLKVPIEIDNSNQLTFSNATAQYAYFSSCDKISETGFTYQRKDGVIRYPAHIDSIITYNYVMYRNDNYSNKWFYAFIDGMRYVNDGMTEISIKTDAWQTWCFDLEFKQSFIEREHVNDDSFGINTIPEGLETGEYIYGSTSQTFPNENNNSGLWICFQITEPVSTIPMSPTQGRVYGNIYSGTAYILTDEYKVADNIIAAYDDAGKKEAIISVFYVPKFMIRNSEGEVDVYSSQVVLHGETCTIYTPKEKFSAYNIGLPFYIEHPTTVDGYTPKNNKLLSYPYSYLFCTNGVGSDIVYKWEDFFLISSGKINPGSRAQFTVSGVLDQGCQIKIIPENYKAAKDRENEETVSLYYDANYDHGVVMGKYPLCSWNSDFYVNWQTQNAVNLATDILSPILGGAANGASSGGAWGALAGAVQGTLQGATSAIGQWYQAQLVPNQAKGNTSTGDVYFSTMGNKVIFQSMSIKKEYAKILDDYFSMFGYKVNSVKVPNITGRANWNYVKTVGCNIHAYAPQEDINEIKEMFNNGVTFWHNPATFLDYSQNNTIIQ